jgi:hypothetical protein
MPDGSNLLSRLSNAIAAAVNPTAKKMTRDEFITYATEQIIAAAKDDPEVAKARLASLDKARVEAKKFDEHDSVQISVFDPAQFTAEQTSTEQDPVKSNDRQDAAPEEGKGEEGQTAKAKVRKYSEVIADLDAILNPQAAKGDGDGTDEQGKAGAPFGGGGGGGGGGTSTDEEEEDEEEDETEMGKDFVPVDENDPAHLFPFDMNEQKFDAKKGKLVRKRRVWGDDPADVRGAAS